MGREVMRWLVRGERDGERRRLVKKEITCLMKKKESEKAVNEENGE